MTKQEFMAMSLPYGLKVFCNEDSNPYRDYDHARYGMEFFKNEYSYIPILRPLSDLTKEIEHNGERFVPMEVIWSLVYPEFKSKTFDFRITTDSIFCHSLSTGYDCHLYTKNIEKNNFWKVQKLIEWHFDIAGLIEKGEAIDVNTLPENPYK